MRLLRAETLFGSKPLPHAADRFCLQSDRSPRGVRLRRHLIIECCGSGPRPVKDERSSRCNTNAFFVSISRRARASAQSPVCTRRCAPDPASLPPRRDLLGLGPARGPSSTWKWIAFPRDPTGALSSRRHSCWRSRRARSPPPRVFLPRRRPTCSVGTSGRAWVRPGGDPGPLDRCLLLTDFVFKDDRLTSRRTSHLMFPHDARARGFTPQCPLRRAAGWRRGVVSLDGRSRRRTSDAPSLAGFPGGTMSTGVGPRSHNDLRSKNPRA